MTSPVEIAQLCTSPPAPLAPTVTIHVPDDHPPIRDAMLFASCGDPTSIAWFGQVRAAQAASCPTQEAYQVITAVLSGSLKSNPEKEVNHGRGRGEQCLKGVGNEHGAAHAARTRPLTKEEDDVKAHWNPGRLVWKGSP